MLKACKKCNFTFTVSSLRSGVVFYDNKGNAIHNCPKCGQELKDDETVNVNVND